LFRRYLEVKSVPALASEMTRDAALAEKVSNATTGASAQSGTVTAPDPYMRRVRSGMLYKLLSNPLYIGKLRHRDLVHDGEHQPLVDDDLFNAVQALLAANAVKPRGSHIHHSDHQTTGHLLTGLLYDDTGDRMSPTHAKAHGRRYRYYVSSRIKATKRTDPSSWRIPAPEIDRTVVQFAATILNDHGQLVDWIKANATNSDIQACLEAARNLRSKLHGAATTSKMSTDQGRLESQRQHEHRVIVSEMFSRITLGTEAITFVVDVSGVVGLLNGSSVKASRSDNDRVEHQVALQLAITVKRRGVEMRLIVEGDQMTRAPDPSLVTLVAKAHVYLEQLTSAPGISITDVANTHRVHRADVGRLLPLAFLAPKLVEQILSGSQPSEMFARFLARADLQHLWTEQIAAFS
jgi:site-specific DNA recombinase